FARIPSDGWAPQPTLGGSGGMKILQASADLIGSGNGFTIAAWGWFAVTFILACVAFAIGWAEIRWVLAFAAYLLMSAAYFLYDRLVAFVDWIKHHTNDDYVASEKPRRHFLIPPRLRGEDEEEVLLETEEDEEEEEYEEEEYEEEYEAEEEETPSTFKVVKAKLAAKSSKPRQKKFQLFDGGEWESP